MNETLETVPESAPEQETEITSFEYVTEEVTEIEEVSEECSSVLADEEQETEMISFEYVTEEVTEIEEISEEYSSAPAEQEQESEYAVTVISDTSSADVVSLLQEQNELIQAQTDAINYNGSMIVFVILAIWAISIIKKSIFKATYIGRKE